MISRQICPSDGVRTPGTVALALDRSAFHALNLARCGSRSGAAEMKEREIERLNVEYHNAMDDIDRLIEANKGDFPRGYAVTELSDRADEIRDRIHDLQRK